jgi:hypothetical protein
MSMFEFQAQNFHTGNAPYLVFTISRGNATAVVFAQHPKNRHATSVVNNIEKLATTAFQTIPELNELNDKAVKIYTTFRLVPTEDRFEDRKLRISEVTFSEGGRYKAKGMTLSKEWRFSGPQWSTPEDLDELSALFDQEAWKYGYVSQVYDQRTGWIPPKSV